uniref:Uncharacterized protein n=1 Tax=Timema tahoe TaxID=61484 RepID=A0A7R9FF98_9NEOP|nr:unnamed protein product [Timema tahoe]
MSHLEESVETGDENVSISDEKSCQRPVGGAQSCRCPVVLDRPAAPHRERSLDDLSAPVGGAVRFLKAAAVTCPVLVSWPVRARANILSWQSVACQSYLGVEVVGARDMSTAKVILSYPWNEGDAGRKQSQPEQEEDDFHEKDYEWVLGDELAQTAKLELREDKDIRNQTLRQFKEWINKNQDLHKCCTGSFEAEICFEAKQKLVFVSKTSQSFEASHTPQVMVHEEVYLLTRFFVSLEWTFCSDS